MRKLEKELGSPGSSPLVTRLVLRCRLAYAGGGGSRDSVEITVENTRCFDSSRTPPMLRQFPEASEEDGSSQRKKAHNPQGENKTSASEEDQGSQDWRGREEDDRKEGGQKDTVKK